MAKFQAPTPLLPARWKRSGCSSTTEVVVQLAPEFHTVLTAGDRVPYMIRERPPRFVLSGPVQVSDDGATLLLQGDPTDPRFISPEASTHLLYLGQRGTHPTSLCAMETDPLVARANVFSVDRVEVQTTPESYALQSVLVKKDRVDWQQLTPWLAVGVVHLSSLCIASGMWYHWPYPEDQTGNAWLLVPNSSASDSPSCPSAVYFVRTSSPEAPTSSTVGGMALQNGDRVLVCAPPARLVEWSQVTQSFDTILGAIPTGMLCISEADASAWWSPDGSTLQPYTSVLKREHARGNQTVSAASNIQWEVSCNHAFFVLTRRSDGLYAATPAGVQSNLGNVNPTGWNWTYPLSVVDGTDRFDGPSATDGLLGLPRSLNQARDADYACLRRRLGPRLLSDPRPPEYLRLVARAVSRCTDPALQHRYGWSSGSPSIRMGHCDGRNVSHVDPSREQPSSVLRRPHRRHSHGWARGQGRLQSQPAWPDKWHPFVATMCGFPRLSMDRRRAGCGNRRRVSHTSVFRTPVHAVV